MKKGFYKILIVIMSVALIGLIIIQFYWLNYSTLDMFSNLHHDSYLYSSIERDTNLLFISFRLLLKPQKKKKKSIIIKDSFNFLKWSSSALCLLPMQNWFTFSFSFFPGQNRNMALISMSPEFSLKKK